MAESTTSRGYAFVTGASRGIGRGIALSLAQAGFDIAGVTRKIEDDKSKGILEVKEKVEALGRKLLPVAGDISNRADHRRMLDEAIAAFGSIDVLVNNAGVAPEKRVDMMEMEEASYDRLLDINLKGPFFLTQLFASQMLKQPAVEGRRKVIIFISSMSARVVSPSRIEYCISKAGLSMAAMGFAARLAEQGVLVYEIRPGIIQTDMTSVVKEKYDNLIAGGLVPQKRWGFPEDIGNTCAALASGVLAYSTGQIIEISGGMQVSVL